MPYAALPGAHLQRLVEGFAVEGIEPHDVSDGRQNFPRYRLIASRVGQDDYYMCVRVRG